MRSYFLAVALSPDTSASVFGRLIGRTKDLIHTRFGKLAGLGAGVAVVSGWSGGASPLVIIVALALGTAMAWLLAQRHFRKPEPNQAVATTA